MNNDGYLPIENYGVIGDLHTVALVGMDGSIDFMSFPRFDSPTSSPPCSTPSSGGRFQLAPVPRRAGAQKQLYLPDTNVLLTRSLVRRRRRRGVRLHARRGRRHEHATPRPPREDGPRRVAFRHASASPASTTRRAGHTESTCAKASPVPSPRVADGTAVRLRSSVPLRSRGRSGGRRSSRCAPARPRVVRPGAGRARVAEPVGSPRTTSREAFKETVNFWRTWVGRSHLPGPLARDGEPLRAGAEAAHLAARTARSSPRRRSGCPRRSAASATGTTATRWIRDASFTLYALIRLGYTAEAGAFMRWIEDALRRARARRLAADHVRHRRPPRPRPRRPSATSRATRARARSASATAPTTSSSSTSTAS